jgi:hypothetical protein
MKKIAMIALLIPGVMMGSDVQAEELEAIIHLSGNSWEDGGFPPSNAGDVFYAVGIINDMEAPLVWDPTTYSYTWYMRDLVSAGETVYGTTHVVNYSGGFFTIYVDNLPSNHDYGINPPNATSPSTFIDYISIYLDGYFDGMTLTYNTSNSSGSFSGTLNFTGGDVFPDLATTDGWTFGSNIGGVSPAGYDLELNGDVYMTVIPVEAASWGAIKSLYR